uniref:Essential protein Yae1 N-terminal domain-containing protein n=1 Tax=Moniliophthora roreri TaxID=221103 RepID=A0A0W0FDK1_MONRR
MAKGNKKSQEPSFELLTNTEFQQRAEKITRNSPEALFALWQRALALGQSGLDSGNTEHIFQQGKEEGLAEGRKIGFQEGKEASAKGRDSVRKEGWKEGYNKGHETGKRVGLEQGTAAGYKEGKAEGYEKGRSAGFAEGSRALRVEAEQELHYKRHTYYKEGFEAGTKARPAGASVAVDTSDLILPTFHTSCSTQTAMDIPSYTSSSTQTTSKTLTPSSSSDLSPSSLNWAEEADTIPPAVLIPCSSPPPRNFTVLRSSQSMSPFSSLQRRTARSVRSDKRTLHRRSAAPLYTYATHPFISRRHPHGIGPGKPVHTFSHSRPPHFSSVVSGSLPPLDWDGDPRLTQLGRILGDLGWVRR